MTEPQPIEGAEELEQPGITAEKLQWSVERGLLTLGGESPEGRLLPLYDVSTLHHRVDADGTWTILGLHMGRYVVVKADPAESHASVQDLADLVWEKRRELDDFDSDFEPEQILAWAEEAAAA